MVTRRPCRGADSLPQQQGVQDLGNMLLQTKSLTKLCALSALLASRGAAHQGSAWEGGRHGQRSHSSPD